MNKLPKTLTTDEMKDYIHDPNAHIIDIRPVDAYNGWKMRNEKRGGHIRGARCLPLKWSSYIDWIEIVRSKKILPGNKIIIYGYDKNDALKVAEVFKKAAYDDLVIYNHFTEEWAEDPDLAMEHLEHYSKLVYPAWLNALIKGEHPDFYEGSNFVICHAHYRNYDDYKEGHIPGAIALDTLELESPETWNRRSPRELEHALLSKGITKETTVILYGRFAYPDNNDPFPGSSAGHLGAIRCAAIMMYAGVKDVKVLNGGLQSWLDEGNTITSEISLPSKADKFGLQIPGNPNFFVDTPDAKQMIESPDAEIISIRSWKEWIGEVSGYNYIEKKGRIPGAVFGNCGSDAYHMENYRNLDHSMREFHEIADIWEEMGVNPGKKLAFYCGTGWRGSEAFMNAYLMGWKNVAVYDGGWFEWSSDPLNPIDTGVPENK